MAEEYSSLVKRYLHRSTIGIGLFFIVLAIDGLPFKKCAFGLFTYISYLPLLADFPFIQPVSFTTIWALVVTLVNHVSWFNYFISDDYRYHLRDTYQQESSFLMGSSPAMKVMGFLFVFVWVVPLGYFISLTSIEESLPFAQGGIGSDGSNGQKKAKGLFKSFVDGLLEKKNQLFPSATNANVTKKTDSYDTYNHY
jgi:hypothetical protein